MLTAIATALAALSFVLLAWQWLAARAFPLHLRFQNADFHPAVTLLKPLKSCDIYTEACLRSWLEQDYPAMQVLFAVNSQEDPAVPLVRRLLDEYKFADSRLLIAEKLEGANAKVAKLAELQRVAKNEILVVSDADVLAPPDLVRQLVRPLKNQNVGLVNCFYRMQDACNLAMQWEAFGTNADFWSQVLQANTLKKMDFALGAVMAVRRACVEEIGGFKALANCLADDYQLGHRVAARAHDIALCTVPVACRNAPVNWASVWNHQIRWARTIRVCQPLPYFFSILSNSTLWPLLLFVIAPGKTIALVSGLLLLARVFLALDLERRLTGKWQISHAPVVLLKDLLNTVVWLMSFLGDTVEWRGRKMRLQHDGTVVAID